MTPPASFFVLRLKGSGLYVAPFRHHDPSGIGWRAWRWSSNLMDAEKFGDRESASAFLAATIPHNEAEVHEIAIGAAA